MVPPVFCYSGRVDNIPNWENMTASQRAIARDYLEKDRAPEDVKPGLLGTATGVLFFVLQIGGAAIHLFTVASIHTLHGVLAAVVAFFLPLFAEVYLFVKAGLVNPQGFNNNYTYFIVFWAIGYALFVWLSRRINA